MSEVHYVNGKNLLDLSADFTWMWDQHFFVETEGCNYVWSDPRYDGDNTLRLYYGSLADYCKEQGIDFGRCKGNHVIRRYCGDDVKVVGE